VWTSIHLTQDNQWGFMGTVINFKYHKALVISGVVDLLLSSQRLFSVEFHTHLIDYLRG
jgi:hypothetical protein